ncbi:MAG: hypothetical protein Q8922_00930 [Bacteroidota bacterium]|nr:hypothetical protein [Bacteroidota bacterium]MDP4232597.1 hypothetical protein [Bacteroidota bacterium]MDP4242949.1 hypothetical protein [Bacteroidota bacterium]MDP4286476.1 hypothetical protein [Bacteroidota bacterium]
MAEGLRFQGIPPEDLAAFEAIFVADDKAFGEIQTALNSAPKDLKALAIIEHIAKLTNVIPRETLKTLIVSIKSLLSAMDRYRIKAADASRDIVGQSLQQGLTTLKREDAEKYESRLSVFLNNPQLVLSSKALNVLTDHNRTFGTVRIITDLRPIFGEDPAEEPHAWMLYHTLHLRCNLGKDIEDDIYVALDTADLRAMQAAIERATTKQKILINKIRGFKLDYLTPDEVEA